MSNKKKIKAKKVSSAPSGKGAKKESVWKTKIWPALRFFFSTMFSNDACVEGRKKKWYGPVGIALLSLVVALIPITVTHFTQSGGVIMDTPTYSLDVQLAEFSRELAAKDIDLVVEDGKLTNPGGTWSTNYGETERGCYFHTYSYETVTIPEVEEGETATPVYETVEVVDFAVYYIGNHNRTAAEYALNNVLDSAQVSGSAYSPKTTSFMVLHQDGYAIYLKPNYNAESTNSVIKSSGGDWTIGTLDGFNFKDMATTSFATGEAYKNSYETDPRAYVEEVRLSYQKFFHEGAYTNVLIQAFTWLGIYAAIFVALTFILGLTVFLMTRGKRNPFNTYSFWDGQKIAYWASFTPALLAMILSFMLPNYAILFYIFAYGMRIMWMSMKSLRPNYGE